MRKADPPGRNVLRRAVGGQRRDVVLGAVLGMGHQTGEALVPVLIGLAIERGVVDGDVPGLLLWLGVLAAVYVGLSFSFRFSARAGERAAVTAAHHLRTELVGRVLAPEGGAEEGRLPGELTNIATEDAKRVGAVAMALIVAFAATAGLVVGAVALLRVSLALGLLVLLGTPLLLWLGHLLSKPLERRSETEQERAAQASGVAADLVAGLRVLKGIGAEQAAVARYRRVSQDSLAATLRAARAESWQNGVVTLLTGTFIAVVALVGGRLAARGDIGLGELVSSVGLALFLVGPLGEFAWVNAELAQGRASAARIAEVLDAPGDVSEAPSADAVPRGDVEGRLTLRALTYGTLRGVDLDIAPGETVGVATTDPADASALLRCLGRRVDPDEGAVELDGTELTALCLADVRAAILVAEHDADLFEGTVLDNVTAAVGATAPVGATAASAGATGASAEVTAAMVASGTDEVARALPDGVDTAVTARGRSLSGGQRQRVALARALAADAPVLVVHEPATAVDAVTETRIAAGIRDVRGGRTTLLVTNSPALLAVTDRAVLLRDGRVTATGVHERLVHECADYRTAVLT
ncbi:ABC transporter ATP-binding protein [Streptomyces europaeiscabiei]|uniref:ABC transporter ATP-binding protein n=1 Tax=Streptomyces europaeiscabiei TaxID=146819 RepID=A0ABU4NE81_9ACTN|nr:ABC transporter ATP-binding protein [Streptomyces europaeiscabiei]MDX2759740.1 ABC transporter ATP-binding protein [Streptomyces europaeiscabiei]MDX3544052.1 ABC transporter ATP-binding protein [Streptomyces europaeiscabiei]MDX3552286.1 ABC transporter ATP-binding protein [Streptomyces europaeiscabiei]MDX3701078.1 ABC transporter ATP-binding protein [Streptomyces europaeiscabiei]MDX3713957.1 ABC transporter ATP-binding protein [Streptomyces europaeiscabiei]